MNKIILASVTIIVVAVALLATVVFAPSLILPQPQQDALDFTVTGKNDCLRFLERTVKAVYVPFRTGANEQWRLTIECVEMPGSGGWTDIYLYNGYWDGGSNHVCQAEDMYCILSDIPASEHRMSTDRPFSEVFGETTPQGYTVFFVYPPGGEGTFHIKLEQVN